MGEDPIHSEFTSEEWKLTEHFGLYSSLMSHQTDSTNPKRTVRLKPYRSEMPHSVQTYQGCIERP